MAAGAMNVNRVWAASLYSAQVAVGLQDGILARTELGIMNRTDRTVSLRLNFYRDEGVPFRVRLALTPGPQWAEATTFNLELPPGGTLNATVSNCDPAEPACPGSQIRAGYAQFEVDDVQDIEVETVFLNISTNTGKTRTAVGVPVRSSAPRWFFNTRLSEYYHFGTGQRIRVESGLAIANPNDSAIGLRITLLRADGSEFDAASLELGPGQHLARFISELFPNAFPSLPLGSGGFRVGIEADLPVAVLALRADVSDEFLISGQPVFERD